MDNESAFLAYEPRYPCGLAFQKQTVTLFFLQPFRLLFYIGKVVAHRMMIHGFDHTAAVSKSDMV